MDYKHVGAVILGVLLGVAGAFLKYDFKGDVCGSGPAPQSALK